MYILAVIGVILAVLLNTVVSESGFDTVISYLDAVSILQFAIIIIPILAASGLLKDFNNALKLVIGRKKAESMLQLKRAKEAVKLVGNTSLASGAMATCCGFIVSVHNSISSTGIDIEKLAFDFAVSVLTTFYGLVLYLLLLPVKSKIEIKISEFMQD